MGTRCERRHACKARIFTFVRFLRAFRSAPKDIGPRGLGRNASPTYTFVHLYSVSIGARWYWSAPKKPLLWNMHDRAMYLLLGTALAPGRLAGILCRREPATPATRLEFMLAVVLSCSSSS